MSDIVTQQQPGAARADGRQQRFTDVAHVLAQLNMLDEDFRRIQELSVELAHLRQDQATRLEKLERIMADVDLKFTDLDAQAGTVRRTIADMRELSDTIRIGYERMGTEIRQKLEELSQHQRTRIDEIEQVSQDWRAAEQRQAEQWRMALTQEVSTRIGAIAQKADMVAGQSQVVAETVGQLTQRHSDFERQLRDDLGQIRDVIAADRQAWQETALALKDDTLSLRDSTRMLRNGLIGASVALLVLVVMCIFLLLR